MAESVKVLCRCRPLNDREKALSSKVCSEMISAEGKVLLYPPDNDPPKEFTFDGAYFMDSTAEQIYNESVFPLVESVIEGYNGTVFAYGQTGSGKTFSMQGLEDVPTQKGIIPRAFEHIFETTATTSDMKFLVHASYLEIYNEEVRDLLGDTKNAKLEIKEGGDRGVYVAGLSMHVCHDVNGCADLMKKGFNNRHVGATLMNKDSSRSHSIFTVYVEAMNTEGTIRMGKLNLVDLAGSERQSKTGATGDRFKEATKINLSLSALGNVISALVDGKSKHIPYRDSKLTRLLQDSLGGNTKTIMVACISPSDNNFDETLSTLRYANRAKNIKNKPRINEDPKDALLREYQEEIERLKAMVGPGGAVVIPSAFDVEAERAKLRGEFEEAMNELKNNYEREQTTKAGLQADLVSLKEQYERANANINEQASGGTKIDADEAKRRIEQLEHTLVGGEQANNEALKQKRLAKIKESEKKTQRLAAALNVRSDDPLLQVYSSTQEKLDAVTNQLKKEQSKVKSFQSEIEDLHGEFELDRLDYLETIRKQDQALKLHTAILERVAPLIRKDCNFSNLDKVKRDAAWNDDEGRWILPEVAITRTTLPGMNGITGLGAGINHAISSHFSSAFEDDESKLRKKLAKSTEDAAKNYFQPSKKVDLASKYREDSKRHNAVGNKFSSFTPVSTFDKLLSGVVYTDDVYNSGQQRFSPINNNNIVNSVMKRPVGKLDSLPARI